MKVLTTLLILTTMISAQEGEKATESFVQDSLRAGAQAIDDQYKTQYDNDMIAYENRLRDLIEDHVKSVRQTEVGAYTITVQTDCEFDMDIKPPTQTRFEADCYSAKASAQSTADLVMNAAPTHPPTLDAVRSAVTNCSLELSVVRSFTVHNKCWTEALAAEYKQIYEEFEASMNAKGYTGVLDEETGNVQYTSNVSRMKVDLENHTAEVIETPSPVIGRDAGALD